MTTRSIKSTAAISGPIRPVSFGKSPTPATSAAVTERLTRALFFADQLSPPLTPGARAARSTGMLGDATLRADDFKRRLPTWMSAAGRRQRLRDRAVAQADSLALSRAENEGMALRPDQPSAT